jgi:hypothetical protein
MVPGPILIKLPERPDFRMRILVSYNVQQSYHSGCPDDRGMMKFAYPIIISEPAYLGSWRDELLERIPRSVTPEKRIVKSGR